jgi:hypothetical protein
MQKKTAGLGEVHKLYLFTRALPNLMSTLSELLESCKAKDDDKDEGDECDSSQISFDDEKLAAITDTIRGKFITPLGALVAQFSLYQQLIEHVIDLNQLPDLVINPQHDPELQELRTEQISLQTQAEKLLREARNSWASFATIQLETSPQHGFIFRSTNGDDERQLRANNSAVRVVSIKKVWYDLRIVEISALLPF